jgi:hypothetical protein
MVKVLEWHKWELKINAVHARIEVMFVNDILNRVELSYCGEKCDFMLVTNEHPDELQDMLLNFASLATSIGELKEEEYSERIEYNEGIENE